MTKSLQEIQKENRKFILEAIHGCSYEEAFTLSRVLLAFKIKDVKKNGNGIVFNYDWGNFSSLDENKHGYGFIPYIFCHLFYWDLKKETLEEQSEETQRGINKLFND